MLAKPDVNVERILDLSNYMENLDPSLYDQRTLGRSVLGDSKSPCCIWGHIRLREHNYDMNIQDLGNFLGLAVDQICGVVSNIGNKQPTNKEAASMLRHLAVTGEIKWPE